MISPARHRFGKTSAKPRSKTPEPARQRVRNIPLKHDRMPPINQNDAGGTDPTVSSYKADLAFQRAMQSAIECGLEHAPIGVLKDLRPLTAPRLFEPVPHSSGCTSPAQECAELLPQKN